MTSFPDGPHGAVGLAMYLQWRSRRPSNAPYVTCGLTGPVLVLECLSSERRNFMREARVGCVGSTSSIWTVCTRGPLCPEAPLSAWNSSSAVGGWASVCGKVLLFEKSTGSMVCCGHDLSARCQTQPATSEQRTETHSWEEACGRLHGVFLRIACSLSFPQCVHPLEPFCISTVPY